MKKILLLGGSAQQVIAIETAKKMGLYGCPAIGDVHRDILKILDESRLITTEELKTKSRGTAVLTAFLKLLAPLM